PYDLRDHIAGSADDDRIADAHVLAPHLVFVVQGRVGDRDAADEHRFQARHRRYRAGAPDLNLDGDDFGGHLFGRKLVRDCEARRPRHEAEALLLREIVDLVHDAVDLVGQRVALLAEATVVVENAVETAYHRALARHRQTQ